MLQPPDVTTASFGEEEELDEDEEREKQAELQNFLNAASENAGNLWDVSFSSLGDARDRGIDFTQEEEAIINSAGQPLFAEQYLARQPIAAEPSSAVGPQERVGPSSFSPPAATYRQQDNQFISNGYPLTERYLNKPCSQVMHPPVADHHPSWRDMARSSEDYQVSQLSNQIVEYQQENQKLQQKVIDMQQELEKQQRIQHHYLELQKQESQALQTQLDQCQSKLRDVSSENQTLHQQLTSASQISDRATQEKMEASEQVLSLKSTVSDLQVQLQQVSSSQSLSREKEEHEKQLEQLREKQKMEVTLQQQVADSVRNQLIKEQGSVHRLEAEVAVLTSEIQQLRLERDNALRRASLPNDSSYSRAVCTDCTNLRSAYTTAERQCNELKAEMAAVAGLLRGLPCWNFDEDDDVGLSTTASSLMVTPGVVQHSTPLSASNRLPSSCRDIISLLSVRVKKLQETAKSSTNLSGSQRSATDRGEIDRQHHEVASLRLQLSELESERDALLAKATKLETSQASSALLEAEMKSRIEVLQHDLKQQWQSCEEDKKASLESFYSQLMDLHGNSSQRLKERMQMVSSAERQKLLVSHAEELSHLRSELLTAQSEAMRVKEEYVRLRETSQNERRAAQEQAKLVHDSAVESLRRSHENSLQHVEERHQQEIARQLCSLKEQHLRELAEVQKEGVSQRLALLKQASERMKVVQSDAGTQTENGPVLSSVQKHLTQDLMKIAVELFHKCIREWEARQRVS